MSALTGKLQWECRWAKGENYRKNKEVLLFFRGNVKVGSFNSYQADSPSRWERSIALDWMIWLSDVIG
ncbi:MAG: hypothetical protein NNA20_10290 [Nitrospira sp.]|nr:hypothetical protein [Nitrospira sp.]